MENNVDDIMKTNKILKYATFHVEPDFSYVKVHIEQTVWCIKMIEVRELR